MYTIDEVLKRFEAISLDEMESVRLLNRIDTKFLFHSSKLLSILERMSENYFLLEVEGKRKCRYETKYFDTPEHLMYHQHHNGKLNRFKVRTRKYIESEQSFFEIKFKNSRGRTIKTRVLINDIDAPIEEQASNLLTQITPFTIDMLKPALRVNYTRMTFVNKNLTERVTIDVDLGFRHDEKGQSYPSLAIAELKQSRSRQSFFRSILHEVHVAESSISKYCLGIISLNDNVKKNNFKPKLSLINKIEHDLS
jgi:hypothetical protein